MYSELIYFENKAGVHVTSAKNFHKKSKVEMPFSIWFEKVLSNGFKSGLDYWPLEEKNHLEQMVIQDYHISVEMGQAISKLTF